MRFNERFGGFRTLRIKEKCTGRHLFQYDGLQSKIDAVKS